MAIAERAAAQEQRRDREVVSGDDPLQVGRVRTKLALKRRQRDIDRACPHKTEAGTEDCGNEDPSRVRLVLVFVVCVQSGRPNVVMRVSVWYPVKGISAEDGSYFTGPRHSPGRREKTAVTGEDWSTMGNFVIPDL